MKQLFTIAVVLLNALVQGQNLVPNSSFELVDSCFTPPNVLGYTPGHRPQNWYPVYDSPDYFNACETPGSPGDVPDNLLTHQYALDGNAYSGMLTYFQEFDGAHELIGVELTEPLMVGETYTASMYVNAAFGGSEWPILATNNMGMLFTMEADEWVPGTEYGFRNYAQMYSSALINDTIGWTLVYGSFVADSAYQYIVVGNHFDNASTLVDTLGGNDTIAGLYRAYVLVDQICVSAGPLGCGLGLNTSDLRQTALRAYPNPTQEFISVEGLEPGDDLRVFDAVGTEVWHVTMQSRRTDLQVATWSRGVYLVKIGRKGERRSLTFVVID